MFSDNSASFPFVCSLSFLPIMVFWFLNYFFPPVSGGFFFAWSFPCSKGCIDSAMTLFMGVSLEHVSYYCHSSEYQHWLCLVDRKVKADRLCLSAEGSYLNNVNVPVPCIDSPVTPVSAPWQNSHHWLKTGPEGFIPLKNVADIKLQKWFCNILIIQFKKPILFSSYLWSYFKEFFLET